MAAAIASILLVALKNKTWHVDVAGYWSSICLIVHDRLWTKGTVVDTKRATNTFKLFLMLASRRRNSHFIIPLHEETCYKEGPRMSISSLPFTLIHLPACFKTPVIWLPLQLLHMLNSSSLSWMTYTGQQALYPIRKQPMTTLFTIIFGPLVLLVPPLRLPEKSVLHRR